jgi:ABC-2 type transport system permease protein
VVLAYLARYAFGSELAFWGVLAFAAMLGAAFYWIAMDSAVNTALRRRELLLVELGRGEGPVVTQ